MASRLQLQQDPVMDRVPSEIIAAFGHYLNGPSLLASIQVCQRWHQVLRPLIWTSITKRQFSHPQFPLHNQCTPEDIDALHSDLFQVRHIEWSCEVAICYRDLIDGRPTTPLQQLSTDKMALIFTYTPNLETLSLDLWGMDTYFSCLEALNQQTLRKLEIEVSKEEAVVPDKIHPLLSGLEELTLCGRESGWKTFIPQPLPPPGTIWKLTRLHIYCLDKALLLYCPELRQLELYWPRQDDPEDPLEFQEVLTCTKLETLTFTPLGRFPRIKDLPQVLTSLRGLKRLTFSAYSVEEVEFLYALDEHAMLPAGQMSAQMTERSTKSLGSRRGHEDQVLVLPLLEHLKISIENLPTGNYWSRLHHSLNRILECRPALKTIIVRNFEFDPRELSMEDWACRDLETLSLEFSWTLSTLPGEERVALWRHVFRQLGTLSRLKSLMIWCAGLEMGVDSGIAALAGASGLERLALADEISRTWSREDLWKLLHILPKLTTLCLFPSENNDDDEVRASLRESERSIELISYGAMMRHLGVDTIA
ncbi:hypothetical protein BGZ75_006232 [Mortierella antarctica]|nr:hypothetical protein BGZ75_006232 [Mortierella antarctica]